VILEGLAPSPGPIPLAPEPDGYFSGTARDVNPGTLYRIRLNGRNLFPDPASRCQPEGPHGPSRVVDPGSFPWTDAAWPGSSLRGQVVYELHVGTFTPEGSLDAARRQLPELADLGITLIELMPLADFPGRFGWGYDGVGLWAPTCLYGGPDALRAFVNAAHAAGIGVILDVVYNHLGPDGNYLTQFSPAYFSSRYDNEWGDALNFDGPGSGPVREYFVSNAAYWIEEYHLDGLRLDATQQIFDTSPVHVVRELVEAARRAAGARSIVIVVENEEQRTGFARPPEAGGYGGDALWNDDFHHTACVALTGRNEAYYTDYLGAPQELISAVRFGFLYQGQRYKWQKKRRGTPALDFRPEQFVNYIENHDQVANSGRGERLGRRTSPGRLRAMTTLLLLSPGTPMLFQGQEFAASAPFLFFADHHPELARAVRRGRHEFLSQFRSLARPEMEPLLEDPGDLSAFSRSRLDLGERRAHEPVYRMHKDLLRLRRTDPVFSAQIRPEGAVLGPEAFLLRFPGRQGNDRLLIVNLGRDLHLDPAPEPLLAPSEGTAWETLFSTEDPCYGGSGTFPPDSGENWRIPGHAAVVLEPRIVPDAPNGGNA
jgi:maltooligosyltrehalose trehalohydrolase